MSVPVKYSNKGGPGIPILVVKRPDIPPTMKSPNGVAFIFRLKISNKVTIKRRILIPSLKASISIDINIKIPKGTPAILPKVNLFSRVISMSFFILQMNETEIIIDNIMLICIASCGRNNINKKGVAKIEKPNPVLVCKMEAIKIMHAKTKNVPKIDLLRKLLKMKALREPALF